MALLCLLPKRLQSRSLEMISYPYINMEAAIKNALSMLQEAGFKLKEALKVEEPYWEKRLAWR